MTNTLNPWRYWPSYHIQRFVRGGWQIGCDALYEYRRKTK